MAVYHAKTSPVGDWTGTVTVFNSQGSTATIAASNLILPADHNSVHNEFYTLGGNTAVQSTASGTGVRFHGLGNITMVGSTGTVGISGHDAFRLSGNTNNASTVSGTNLVFQGLGGITLVGSTGTIGISAATGGGGATVDGYVEPFFDREWLAAQIGNNQLFLQPMNLRAAVAMDNILWPNNFSNATNSSGSATLTLQIGIYTRTNSTLSLLTSVSASFAMTASGTVGSYSLYGGVREFPIPLTTTLNADNYWIGFLSRTTTGGAAGMTWSNFVASNINSAYSGRWSSANNATNQWVMGLGSFNTTTTAIRDSIALSQINGSAAVNLRPVIYRLGSGDLN